LAFERAGLLFAFNFHPNRSANNFFLPANQTGEGQYKAIFSTDEEDFGGQNRIDKKYIYETKQDTKCGIGFEIYLPCRTAIVFKKQK
jgi:1,4-alpha-glucan branching enzyme